MSTLEQAETEFWGLGATALLMGGGGGPAFVPGLPKAAPALGRCLQYIHDVGQGRPWQLRGLRQGPKGQFQEV